MFVAFILITLVAGFVLGIILTSRLFWTVLAAVIGALLVSHYAGAIITGVVIIGIAGLFAVVGAFVWKWLRPHPTPVIDDEPAQTGPVLKTVF